MIRQVKRFFALSSKEKRFFLEAYILLACMRAAIALISFKRLTRSLTPLPKTIEPEELTAEQLHTATLVANAIKQAAGNTLWESACLVQALTAQRMLARRDIPGLFYLGVKKETGVMENMEAHAWSRCGETIITGESGCESFTVLSVFGWGRS